MTCVTLVKAALARFLFAIHALMTIWRVVQQEGDDYWKLAVGILCLLGEGTLHSDQFYYISGYKNELICKEISTLGQILFCLLKFRYVI